MCFPSAPIGEPFESVNERRFQAPSADFGPKFTLAKGLKKALGKEVEEAANEKFKKAVEDYISEVSGNTEPPSADHIEQAVWLVIVTGEDYNRTPCRLWVKEKALHCSTFSDYAVGRSEGQYLSWSVNFLNSYYASQRLARRRTSIRAFGRSRERESMVGNVPGILRRQTRDGTMDQYPRERDQAQNEEIACVERPASCPLFSLLASSLITSAASQWQKG